MNNVYLMQRLFHLQMFEGGSVADHINESNIIISQLSLMKINFEEKIKALILMSSLPGSWILLLPQSIVSEDLIN